MNDFDMKTFTQKLFFLEKKWSLNKSKKNLKQRKTWSSQFQFVLYLKSTDNASFVN